MTRAIAGFSDRLLLVFAPKATAKADPCGEYYEYCGCWWTPNGYRKYQKFCCSNGGCSSNCYPYAYC